MADRNLEHCVVATVTVVNKDMKYLIAKRADCEDNFCGKWTVAGGKMKVSDYFYKKKDSEHHWHNVLEYVARKEVDEEVGLKIASLGYLINSIYIRSDGLPCLVVSLFAAEKSGKIELCKDLTDFAWVSSGEAVDYDLIDGLAREFKLLDKKLRRGDNAIREILEASRKY